jgi:hypothetical protein
LALLNGQRKGWLKKKSVSGVSQGIQMQKVAMEIQQVLRLISGLRLILAAKLLSTALDIPLGTDCERLTVRLK